MSISPLQSTAFNTQAPAGTPVARAAADTSSTANADTGAANLGSTFLQLLTQELQNQDPTAPMDSTQMVAQMISLNQLEQLTSINQTLSKSTATATTGTATGKAMPVSAAVTNATGVAQAALQAASMGNTLGSTAGTLTNISGL